MLLSQHSFRVRLSLVLASFTVGEVVVFIGINTATTR